MDALWLILSPIESAMRIFLVLAHSFTGDFGVAIILLSLTVRVLTAPIAALAARSQERARSVQAAMAPELARIRATSTGRERFERTEALYKLHGYHPIHSVKALLPLFLQIPFLIAAFFLLSDFAPLAGERFLVIPDLLRPDGLVTLGGIEINILPLLITAIVLMESAIRTGGEAGDRFRFLLVALVIAVLIYPATAAVCLYWLTTNLLSLARAAAKRFTNGAAREQSA
ncbi:MAG: membrane protein insertase YidC [Pseudomonadota bacterium]|nr:membrane protein insertase YidC [Pseudomonadota bacterium]